MVDFEAMKIGLLSELKEVVQKLQRHLAKSEKLFKAEQEAAAGFAALQAEARGARTIQEMYVGKAQVFERRIAECRVAAFRSASLDPNEEQIGFVESTGHALTWAPSSVSVRCYDGGSLIASLSLNGMEGQVPKTVGARMSKELDEHVAEERKRRLCAKMRAEEAAARLEHRANTLQRIRSSLSEFGCREAADACERLVAEVIDMNATRSAIRAPLEKLVADEIRHAPASTGAWLVVGRKRDNGRVVKRVFAARSGALETAVASKGELDDIKVVFDEHRRTPGASPADVARACYRSLVEILRHAGYTEHA